jgi:hypothetical protein
MKGLTQNLNRMVGLAETLSNQINAAQSNRSDLNLLLNQRIELGIKHNCILFRMADFILGLTDLELKDATELLSIWNYEYEQAAKFAKANNTKLIVEVNARESEPHLKTIKTNLCTHIEKSGIKTDFMRNYQSLKYTLNNIQ